MNRENLISEIKSKFQDYVSGIESTQSYMRAIFKSARSAIYHFEFFVYSDGDAEIIAKLDVVNSKPNTETYYFWSYPIESEDYPSEEAMAAKVLELLERFLKHRTRIIQKKGWFSQSFSCEYFVSDKWSKIDGSSAFRYSNFKFPPTNKTVKVYDQVEGIP